MNLKRWWPRYLLTLILFATSCTGLTPDYAQISVGILSSGGSASTPIALVSTGSGSAVGPATSIVTGTGGTAFSCAAGNSVLVFFSSLTNVSPTITDSGGNTYANYSNTPYHGSTGFGLYYTFSSSINIASSVTSVTATFTSASYNSIVAHCISGPLTHTDTTLGQLTNPITGGGGSAFSSATFTTGCTNEIVFTGTSGGASLLISTATSPSLVGANYSFFSSLISMGSIYSVYSSTQTGITQAGTFTGNQASDNITIGLCE